MRPSHKNRNRNRHRGSGGGGGSSGGNPLNRVYESNGPDVKVRGTAQTVADKYLQLGRDAQSSGDSVMAESYFQHAEHYLRIIAAAQAYNQQIQQQYRRPEDDFDDEELEESPEAAQVETRGGQPSPNGTQIEGTGDQPQVRAEDDRSQQRQSRDRGRSRWQDRRDGGDQRRSSAQPRGDEQSPAADDRSESEATREDGKWEAPSFLRRPAAPSAADEYPAVAEPAIAGDGDVEVKPASQPKRRYERKSRSKEPVEEVAAVEAPTASD